MTTSPLVEATPRRTSVTERLEVANEAAARAQKLHGERLLGRVVEVHPAVASLLPDGGLRAGGAYAVQGSHGLLAAMLSAPSSAGQWCGVVGLPAFAAEAARALGCDLDRMVFVPQPGGDWLNVVAALIDALPFVVVRPPADVSAAEASRIGARLRKREAVLLTAGPWPRVEARLTAKASRWQGLGRGHGHLAARLLTVETSTRSAGATEHVLWLPNPQGGIEVARRAALSPPETAAERSLRAMAG